MTLILGQVIHCVISLPLLPTIEVKDGLEDIRLLASGLETSQQLVNWQLKSTVGPQRVGVCSTRARANNILDRSQPRLQRRIMSAHPNIYTFLRHLQRVTG